MQAPIIKNLLHEELRLKLKKLAEEAKVRFAKMNLFPTASWEDQSWVYQGKDRVYFFDKSALNDELALLNKVFVISYLWDSRARSKPLGSTRIRSLAASVKLLAKVNVAGLGDINQHAYDLVIQ